MSNDFDSEFKELRRQVDRDMEALHRKSLEQPKGILDGDVAAEKRARNHQYKQDILALQKKWGK